MRSDSQHLMPRIELASLLQVPLLGAGPWASIVLANADWIPQESGRAAISALVATLITGTGLLGVAWLLRSALDRDRGSERSVGRWIGTFSEVATRLRSEPLASHRRAEAMEFQFRTYVPMVLGWTALIVIFQCLSVG